MEIPGGGGKSCQALWNGKSWGVGAQTGKNPPWGGYGYFLEPHNVNLKGVLQTGNFVHKVVNKNTSFRTKLQSILQKFSQTLNNKLVVPKNGHLHLSK